MATALRDLVFVHGRGFMPAHALGTRSNVVVEREGKTFVGAVVPERDGVRVIFTVRGFATGLKQGNVSSRASVIDDRGRALATRPRWTTSAYLRLDPLPTLHHTMVLERPESDARHLELEFDGPAGEWQVRLPLEPLEPIEHDGTPGRTVEALDHKLGVTVAVRAIARSAEVTVVEVEAYLDPPSTAEGWARSYVTGIGPTLHSGRLDAGHLVLRDETGTVHQERGMPIPEQAGSKQREAITFPALPVTVHNGTVELDVVWVHEGTDEIAKVSVPGEADITVAGCTGRVTLTRMTPREGHFQHLPEGSARSAIHIETRPHDLEADRQLVYMPPAVQRIGMSVGHCFGQFPTVDLPETTDQLAAVTFRGGTVQVRGPWRLEIPLTI